MALNIPYAQHLHKAINDLPNEFVFNGTTYEGIIDETANALNLTDMGAFEDSSLVIVALADDFATLPVRNQTVTVSNTVYRVIRTIVEPDDECIRLECREETD